MFNPNFLRYEINCNNENTENISDVEHTSLKIYPTPANERLYIETEFKIEEISILDVYGRHQVAKVLSRQNNTSVDLSELKSGVYFVKIYTDKGNFIKRIIKD